MKCAVAVVLIAAFLVEDARAGGDDRPGPAPRCTEACDPRVVEDQVREAGRRYVDLLRRLHSGRRYEALRESGDLDELERTLASDFTYTDPAGRANGRDAELAAYRDLDATIDSAEILEQNVRVIAHSVALEAIVVRYVGLHEKRPYAITKRSTLLWAWREGRWQIVSDHSSRVAEPGDLRRDQ